MRASSTNNSAKRTAPWMRSNEPWLSASRRNCFATHRISMSLAITLGLKVCFTVFTKTNGGSYAFLSAQPQRAHGPVRPRLVDAHGIEWLQAGTTTYVGTAVNGCTKNCTQDEDI